MANSQWGFTPFAKGSGGGGCMSRQSGHAKCAGVSSSTYLNVFKRAKGITVYIFIQMIINNLLKK